MNREAEDVAKLKAIRRAEFALRQRLERIEFEHRVLLPEVDSLKQGPLRLPPATIVQVDYEAA